MADNSVIDILVTKQARKELEDVNVSLKEGLDLILQWNKANRESNKQNSVKSPKDLSAQINKNKIATEELNKVTELSLRQNKKIIQSEKALIDARSKSNIEIQKNRLETSILNRQNKQAAILSSKLSSEYQKLVVRMNRAGSSVQNLTAKKLQGIKLSNKEQSELKQSQLQFAKYQKAVLGADASIGRFQRHVGNYPRALGAAASAARSLAGAMGLVGGAFLFIKVMRDAINIIKNYEKENAKLNAILQKNAKETKALRDNSAELGATTAKTATEVTGLQIAFARLGFTQEEILNLTQATIDGSVAMNSGLSETANLVGAVVRSMDNLSSTDAPMIIDTMALATSKSALNFEKLNTSLPITLGAANALNIPFTKLVATLGKLSDSGIEASTGATALRNIYIESAKLGINYEDALSKITKSTTKLTTANEIFGKRAAVSALIIANNTEKLDELDKALQKAKGTAKEMADKQLDTLSGKVTLLTSAWQGLILSVENGEGTFSKAIKSMITGVTNFIGKLTELNELSTIVSSKDLNSEGWGKFFGPVGMMFSTAETTGKAAETLKNFNNDINDLKKSTTTIDEIRQTYKFYSDILDNTSESEVVLTKLLQNQLDKIEKVYKAKQLQIKIEEKEQDILYEKKQSIIDILLETDKKLKAEDLEKKSLKELNNLLNKYNNLQNNKYLKGSIGYLDEIISANNKLIKQANDRGTIEKLQKENKLLEQQKKLLLEGQRAQAFNVKTTQMGSNASPVDTKLPGTTLEQSKVGYSDFQAIALETEKWMKDNEALINAGIDLTNTFFDNKISKIDAEIQAEQDKYAILLALAGDDEKQRALIEAESEKKRQQLEKKKRKEQRKQAILNKGISIAEIAINTAVAISKAIAASPLTSGLPWSAIAATLGAIQIATVIAQPIPQYKKGTDYHIGGKAIVGDGGVNEVIVTPKGDIALTPDTPTLVDMEKGTKVYPNFDKFKQETTDFSDMVYNASLMASLSIDQKNLRDYISSQKELDKQILSELKLNNQILKNKKLRANFTGNETDFNHELFRLKNTNWNA